MNLKNLFWKVLTSAGEITIGRAPTTTVYDSKEDIHFHQTYFTEPGWGVSPPSVQGFCQFLYKEVGSFYDIRSVKRESSLSLSIEERQFPR